MSLIATFDINDDDGNDHDGGNDRKKQPSNKSPSQPPLRIRHSIYVGGKEDAKSLEKLQQRKITHILNVTPPKVANSQMGVPNYFERQQHFQYLRVPLWDDPTGVRELQEHHASMVTFIHRGLYHGNVLVHCAHGISRSTTIVALYLMERRHMTLAEALAMLQRRRPQAQPIPAFMEYLKRVDVTLDHDGSRLTSAKKRARNAMVEAKGHDTPPGKRRAIGPAMPPTFDDDPARPQSNNMSVGPSLPSPADESKERSKTLPPPETFSYDPEPIQPEWLELPPELQTIDFSTDGAAAASWDKHAPYTEHPLPLVPVGTPPTFSPASPALCFHLHSVDGRARAATLFFPNGGPPVPTPRFMPVGTKGTLKGVLPDEIAAMNCPIILANTYHLAIQPGTALIDERFGGLHKFMGGLAAVEEDSSTKQTTRSQSTSQPRRLYNLLTDSGGFQMVSLASLSNVTEQGVVFQSPYTGKNMMLRPEDSIQCQNEIGADIIMQLDDVISSVKTDEERFRIATFRTLRWYDRCVAAHRNPRRQNLFPILQGHLDTTRGGLRELCLAGFKHRDQQPGKRIPGFAIGGLAGGESKDDFWRVVDHACRHLPDDRPRYLMGVGYPLDLVVCTALGVDQYDCVFPTRTARFGVALVDQGQIKLKQHEYAPGVSEQSTTPIDPECPCEACRRKISKGRLHSLLKANNSIAVQLITQHNVTYMMCLVNRMQAAILEKRFAAFVREFLQRHFGGKDDNVPQWVKDALEAAGVTWRK